MNDYKSPNSFINSINNLNFKNFNRKEYNKPINNPQQKFNSFAKNGKRVFLMTYHIKIQIIFQI